MILICSFFTALLNVKYVLDGNKNHMEIIIVMNPNCHLQVTDDKLIFGVDNFAWLCFCSDLLMKSSIWYYSIFQRLLIKLLWKSFRTLHFKFWFWRNVPIPVWLMMSTILLSDSDRVTLEEPRQTDDKIPNKSHDKPAEP